MMRYLLLATLIFSGELYADSLRVTASADTYILDQRNVASTAGSFSIRMASGDAMTRMNASATTTNYETGTTGRLGLFSDVEDRWLMRWNTLDDSMRTYSPAGKSLVWDSARVIVYITTGVTASPVDSLTIAMYELKSTRVFAENTATWQDYGLSLAWTTGGAGSTTSDIEATYLDTSATLLNASTSMSFKISGTNITDTLNNAGVILRAHRYGNDDGTTCAATIASDDYTTDANKRPLITVYFHEMEYPDFGGADTLLLKRSTESTGVGCPVMTFDISTVTATADLDSLKLWCYVNANYVDNAEGSVNIAPTIAMKPINIGTGTGGATATGKMHWASWYENGTADSAWGAIGATDEGSVCNRSTATGDDRTADQVTGALAWSGTGWKSAKLDTTGLRSYLDGTCANFGIIIVPEKSLTDDAWWVLSSIQGANDPFLVIYYTPAATGATKGTGRFGRANDGRYLNVR